MIDKGKRLTEAQKAAMEKVCPSEYRLSQQEVPTDKSVAEFRIEGQNYLAAANKILDRCSSAQRSMTSDEALAVEGLGTLADNMIIWQDIARERAEIGRQADRQNGGSKIESWRNRDGLLIQALKPEQRMADAIRVDLPDGIRSDELSLGRWLRGITTGEWRGAEAEHRVISSSADTLGGYLVPTPLALQIIDLARASTVCIKAGAVTIPMERGELNIARLTSDIVPSWLRENQAGSFSDANFGQFMLSAKTLAAYAKVSLNLVEDGYGVDQVVSTNMANALSLELDRALLRGIGVAEPLGVRNWTALTGGQSLGAQSINLGTDGDYISLEDFSSAWQKIMTSNGPSTGISAIYAPRTAGELDRMKDGEGQYLKKGPESWEKMTKFVTTSIPINLTHGACSTASEAYVGYFPAMGIGLRTDVRIEVSKEAGDANGSAWTQREIWLRAFLRADIVLQQPAFFCVLDGIKPVA